MTGVDTDHQRRMSNPYERLPESAFWRPAVAQRHLSRIGPLWSPKFDIGPEQRVVTFGSCFAQHIARGLQARGFSWLNTEPSPPGMSKADAMRFNYDLFSCRTGNIYTPSLLLQWTRWAVLEEPAPAEVWEQSGRYIDPFRPAIEPGGFASVDEVLTMRDVTIKAFAEAIRSADCLIFTLGLTESWLNRKYGYEYPMCPGTVAGTFDPELHAFHNLDLLEVADGLQAAIEMMRGVNDKLGIVLTVSPVPLTATNSGAHVMVATMEAKSVLRAVAGQLQRHRSYVDYFPSYEIISSPVTQGVFFEPNRREVSPMGVSFVMDHFFSCLRQKFGTEDPVSGSSLDVTETALENVACEEELLAAFGSQQ